MTQTHEQPVVFVVDEEDFVASTLAMILRLQSGFQARSFTNPLDALEAAQLEAPDLLISDVRMPLLSGLELAIQVRALCPDCKVLLFSGKAANVNLLEAARVSGHNFEILMKPLHPADLLEKIQNLNESVPPLPLARPASMTLSRQSA